MIDDFNDNLFHIIIKLTYSVNVSLYYDIYRPRGNLKFSFSNQLYHELNKLFYESL